MSWMPSSPESGAVLDAQDRASILIVDDLPEKLLVFGSVLEDLGQNLVFAHSGNEALREVLKQEFAVILLDVNMPDIDGFETAALIRRYRKSAHTPIIFITAYADEMQTARGYSLGAVDYILSPVVPEILRSKIKVFVELFLLQKRISRQADERVALAAAESARRAAEENTRRSNFLVHAGRQLADALDIDVAVRKLLNLVVPELADMAGVMLSDDTNLVGREEAHRGVHLAWRADNDADAVMARRALSEWPRSVLQACTAAMNEQRPAPLAAQALSDLHHMVWAQEVQDLGTRPSALDDASSGNEARRHWRAGALLPLVAGERVLGVLLVAAVSGRDGGVLEELADRAAIALENARLYSSLQAEIVERRAAEFKLQASNQRKDEFLAMLSHELRNPLAPIRNAVEVMRRLAPPDTKLQWANDVLDRQVRHLTRLVDELLDVARISQGKINLNQESIDLHAVIEHAVETVRPFIEHRQHRLHLQLPTGPVWMRGDFARLSQVAANLLNNAAKYTEPGGLIRLSLKVEEGQAVITVTDNGMGIEPELLPHVFDLFEQGRRSLDRSQGGLGVGLTLVQRLVQLHHGRVEVASAGEGLGAEFRVCLPCMTLAAAPTAEEKAPASMPQAKGCRVLIVDDNTDTAESVAMVLALNGHEVKTVPDGMQALACIPVFMPEAVLLDIGLPGLDGYDVARRLRQTEETRQALLIALTGYGQREDVARAIEAGFDHHFVKPADPQRLAACIAEARLQKGRPQAGQGASSKG